MPKKIDFQDQYAFNQHTLQDSFSVIGVGLHSGLKSIMSVFPAEPDSGYTFVRRDVSSSRSLIKARWNNVVDTHLSTTIANNMGVRVSTVEHLLAALRGCGVDNAHVVLDAPEVPILDGSAETYVSMINNAGLQVQEAPRRALVIRKPVCVLQGEKFAGFSPARRAQIDVEIEFSSPVIGRQELSLPFNNEIFEREIAAARTFGFTEQISVLKELGYCKGGTVNNALLVDGRQVVNPGGLKFPDEFVRHKYLDVVGDLALVGAHIVGRFTGRATGHQLNNELLRELMMNDNSWIYTTLEAAYTRWSGLAGSATNNVRYLSANEN